MLYVVVTKQYKVIANEIRLYMSFIAKHNGYRRILNPIIDNPIFFIFQFIIINAPVWTYWITQFCPYLRLYAILAAPITLFAAYVLTVVVNRIPKVKVPIYIVTYALSVFEVYIILNFGIRFSHSIFQLIAETTSDEVSEFFSAYILTSKVLIYVILIAAVAGINVLVEISDKVRNAISRCFQFIVNRFAIMVTVILLLSGTASVCRDIRFARYLLTYPYVEVPSKLERAAYSTNYTTFGNLVYAVYMHYSTMQDLELLVRTLSGISEVSSDYTSENVILILGESFNKHHSSLYGYTLPTNPELEKELNNLYVMTDVVSPHNATSKCLRKLFSFSSQDDDQYWANTPLFPALYKTVGYDVAFLSNQECKEGSTSIWNSINNCLVNESTIQYLYDYVNPSTYGYDMDLVEEYGNIPSKDGDRNLVIFHLIGQHVEYNDKYPETEAAFTLSDYEDRKGLTEMQKETIMHYDNATHYNDKVVASIIDEFRNEDAIIVYLSDHSDEVYDYRNHFGRSHEPVISQERAMHQYEVPFMIWVSDIYKETHPVIVEQIQRAVARPFMTDDLPHLMLDLAGINCEWFDPSRSLINDLYNISRKRLLEDSKQDYDEIVKSSN